MTHSFRLKQDGVVVAEVSGADRQACFREIMHYALVYGQDGPCTVEGVSPEDWNAWGPKPATSPPPSPPQEEQR
jgi:hypothetical protein